MSDTNTSVKTILFLINDSDPILLRVIKNKFKKDAGWESIISTNYDAAVLSFLHDKPDIVLTEIILDDEKGRTGFDFITEIKEKEIDKKVQIIIFTDLSQDDDKARAQKLGVNHYFVKSQMSLNQLIDEIKNIVKSA